MITFVSEKSRFSSEETVFFPLWDDNNRSFLGIKYGEIFLFENDFLNLGMHQLLYFWLIINTF